VATIARAAAAGHRALHPFDATVDAAVVATAHAAGLAVNVWTVDDPERMIELASFGVDGICTNVPDVALTALARPSAGRLRGSRGR
jgi:glycerophosphoryl diester phosphodiesterase